MPDPQGLTSEDAARRLSENGRNELVRKEGPGAIVQLARQFTGLTVILLIVACGVAFMIGETVEAVAIGVIVLINGIVGFLQEYRAEQAIKALRSMAAPLARVVRDGKTVSVPSAEVAPGDLLIVEAGDLVAADATLVAARSLQTGEAALTGESAPVEKSTDDIPAGTPLAEQRNRVFLGTVVTNGTGRAVVTATGMRTELGRIAALLAETGDTRTPLQDRLEQVGRSLLVACLGIVTVVALLGLWRGSPPMEVLMSSVSLAIAAVPEGLPAIVTIALAVGVQRMVERNVLVRRLPAVETLGCATVICTDKTGTLTTGVMTVREVWSPDPKALLFAAAACSDAELDGTGLSGRGDTTEIALLVEAARLGVRREEIENVIPRVMENPFDSVRKRMSIWRGDEVLYVKGALESLLEVCSHSLPGVKEAAAQMAEKGLRVIGVATGSDYEEKNLSLLGVVGIADPPRPEAIRAVEQAHRAGIHTVMITGDHPVTARTIAAELGIIRDGHSEHEHVHARVTPEEKLTIVRRLKEQGHIVAMTGDGVNDAPALKEAHIGIAMGKAGTEVAREASDMILLDDNFASIVAAIQEGRGIYENIRKTLVYLLAGNAGELTLMLCASLMGLPLPLLPLQILWINLVTDGLPALALVMDPAESGLLERPPRSPAEPILGQRQWAYVVLVGALEAALVLGVYVHTLHAEGLQPARTMAFSVMVFCELFRAFTARSVVHTYWEVGAFSNLRLVAVILLSSCIQLGIHHVPFTRGLFGLTHLTAAEGLTALALGLIPVTVLEIFKLLRRWFTPPVVSGTAGK